LWNEIELPGIPTALTSYKPDLYSEQFSEGLALWLLPKEKLGGRYCNGPERLMETARELLAFFNELVGWPADQAPLALRGT
jgi:hypothetical protein